MSNTTLPTYKRTQSYNNADQLTLTQTYIGTQNGNTYGQAYDSTTGLSVGISWDGIGVADLVSQSYNEYGLVSGLQLYGNNGNPLATESFTYDGNLRPLSTTADWLANSGKNGTIFSNTRAYDPVGNVTTVSTTHQAADGASGSGGSETKTSAMTNRTA